MKKRKKFYILILLGLGLSAGVLAALQGCTSNVPSLAIYPTPSAHGTPTFTPCVSGVLLPSYEFETDAQCWAASSAEVLSGVTSSISNTVTHGGTGSLQTVIPFSAANQNLTLRLSFGSPVNLTGKTISGWVSAGGGVIGTGTGIVTMFVMSGSGYCWEDNGYTGNLNSGNVDTWVQFSFTPTWGGACSPDSTQVRAIGINVRSGAGAGPATVYLDDVTITSAAAGPTATPTTACVPTLFNGAESLTENGTWSGGNALFNLSTTDVTQGTQSLDINIVAGAGWNDNFLLLSGFAPTVWSGHTTLLVDANVDAGVVAGAGYTQLLLFADSSANGKYYSQISSSAPPVVAGQQTFAWTLDFPNAGTGIDASMALSNIRFIYNNSATSGMGHIYLDNMRFCP